MHCGLVFCCGGEELHAQWVGVAVALPAVTAYNGMMIPARTTCTCLCVARLTEWGVTDPQRNHNNFSQGGVCCSSLLAAPLRVSMCIAPTALATLTSPLFNKGVGSIQFKTQEEKYYRTLQVTALAVGGSSMPGFAVPLTDNVITTRRKSTHTVGLGLRCLQVVCRGMG